MLQPVERRRQREVLRWGPVLPAAGAKAVVAQPVRPWSPRESSERSLSREPSARSLGQLASEDPFKIAPGDPERRQELHRVAQDLLDLILLPAQLHVAQRLA